MSHWTRKLVALGACPDAVDWAKTQPNLLTAWTECKRADWMLWLLARLHVDRKPVVWLGCQCARTSFKHLEKGEKHPRIAIETTERWCNDKATIAEVREARRNAVTAATTYADAAADAAAVAAADAYACADAAAVAAARAAAYAARAGTYADATDAYNKANISMAKMIRRNVPDPNDVSGIKFTKPRSK